MSDRSDDSSEWGQRLPHAELSGVASSALAEVFLTAARDVRPVVERIYLGTTGPGADKMLRTIGRSIAESDGARRRLAGYVFEQLDSQRHNLRQMGQPAAVRRLMELCDGPTFRGYDAFRTGGGKAAEAIQHKLCELNIRPAIAQLESWWPGSASATTFRVPSDVADRAQLLAGERSLVEASEFSRRQIYKQVDRGADQLARHGGRATSRLFQTARAGAKSGAIAAVVGGAFDAPKLYRREIGGKHFVARRGMDAAEGAVTTVATSGAVAATLSVAGSIAAGGGAGAATAAAVLTAPTWVPVLVGGLLVGTGVRYVAKQVRPLVDDLFTSEAAPVPAAVSPLVEDLDAYRPRPWVPAVAAAMLVVPTFSLWIPKPFEFWRP